MVDRAMQAVWAWFMAEHMDGRLELKPARLTAGVLLVYDFGVSIGVGSGPKRTPVGVGGSMLGLGSKKRGGSEVRGLEGVGVLSFELVISMNRGGSP